MGFFYLESTFKHVFQETKTIYLISSTFLEIWCLQDTSLKVLLKVINYHLLLNPKVAFLVLKPKWYMDSKLVLCSNFLQMVTASNGCFFIQQAFCGYPAFPTFRFLPFENPETREHFHKLIFQGNKTVYLISSTFLGIFCVQNTILEVLLEVVNEHLLLLLESDFSGY